MIYQEWDFDLTSPWHSVTFSTAADYVMFSFQPQDLSQILWDKLLYFYPRDTFIHSIYIYIFSIFQESKDVPPWDCCIAGVANPITATPCAHRAITCLHDIIPHHIKSRATDSWEPLGWYPRIAADAVNYTELSPQIWKRVATPSRRILQKCRIALLSLFRKASYDRSQIASESVPSLRIYCICF